MNQFLFITGMPRSGTTLLEKLVALHPAISVLSQPFPYLMIGAKAQFLSLLGFEDPLPLGPLLRESRYSPRDFARFLGDYRPPPSILREWFRQMEDYSGQGTRFERQRVDSALQSLPGAGGFGPVLAHLLEALGGAGDGDWLGCKEILCEEYLPYLLEQGWRCLLIVRDPRDVLASLNSGAGARYGGDLRPTLFNLRQWRKSVAFLLHCRGQENFRWLRYEDLAQDPAGALDTLDLGRFRSEWYTAGLRDQSGEEWKGNSSHGERRGVDAASVGRYAGCLPEDVVRFTEAACFAELKLLDYQLSISATDVAGVLEGFREPYEITRSDLHGYSDDSRNRSDELERWRIIEDGAAGPGAHSLFLFDGVRERLATAARGCSIMAASDG